MECVAIAPLPSLRRGQATAGARPSLRRGPIAIRAALASHTTRRPSPAVADHDLPAALTAEALATLTPEVLAALAAVAFRMALMELITAEAVATGTTRRSCPAIAGREATSGPWAGLTVAAGTNVTRSAPAPAASASPPNGSHSPPPPRPKSARSLTPTRPAPSDPSGGPPTQPRAKSVRTKPPSGPPPPPPAAAGVPDAEDRRLPREIAHLTYVGAVILGLNNDLENLTSGWVTPAKVVYCGTMMLAVQLLGTGIMADGRLSAICARSGSILSSILLAVSISCRMGRLGWVAGVASSPVIAGTMAAVWMRGEPAAAQAVSRFRGRVVELWRRRQHAAAEAVSSVWGGVVELWRRVPAAGAGVSPPSASGEVLPR